MKKSAFSLMAALTIATAASGPQTFNGVITDSMCGAKHTMNIKPDEKCVRECIKMDSKTKYALLVGSQLFVLADQQTPEKFAGQKVSVTGTVFEKTKILKADKIEAVR